MTANKKVLYLLFCILLCIIAYYFGKNNQPPFSFVEQRGQNAYQFINPLLECDSTNFSQNASLDSLKNNLHNLLTKLITDQKISTASIYYRDLNNGPWIGIHEEEYFSPASLIKVPLMIAYYKVSENNPDILTKTISTSSLPSENQNISPELTLIPNQNYTVDELINRMIIYSDNQAYDLLFRNFDNQLLIKTYRDLGIDISAGYTNPNGNILSVKSYAAFFRILYNASYLNKDLSEKALKLLSQVRYQEGLVKGVNNPQILISHKFGERTFEATGEKQLHDCGIVYLPQKPYLVCIMTKGKDFSQLSSSIAQISQLIYQTLNSP